MKKLINLIIFSLTFYSMLIIGISNSTLMELVSPGFQIYLGSMTILILILNAYWKPGSLLSIAIALISYGLLVTINGLHGTTWIYFLEIGIVFILAAVAVTVGKQLSMQMQKELNTVNMDNENGIYHYQQIQMIIESEFARAFRYGFPIVLIHMKAISDGNDTMENLDQAMVNFLTKYLRMTDILVRLDGLNNFLIICPGIQHDEANLMIERLTTLSRQGNLPGFQHAIAAFPQDGRSFEELYEHLHQ